MIAASCATKSLRDQSTPVLFVQGTRDSLFPLEVLVWRSLRAAIIRCASRRDYLKASGEMQDDADRRILEVIQKFVTKHSETLG